MSMNKTDRDNWRKFLGIKEPSTALDVNRVGIDIGKTVGRSGGARTGGSIDSDGIPEGDGSSGAEKGDGAGDAGEKIKVGDELDRLEDLYDCETGEEVTIDGLGEKGSERYPTGFQDCEKQELPPEDWQSGYYWEANQYYSGNDGSNVRSGGRFQTYGEAALIVDKNIFAKSSPFWSVGWAEAKAKKQAWQNTFGFENIGGVIYTGSAEIFRRNCDVTYDPICALPPPIPKWPAVDRNHLTWSKEKGCFEPLCPELNNQVLDKYKACEEDRILCDKDGNKVKVTIDGDTVKVTQAKYNQTSEIRNGKVQAVKQLTESQTEAEFK